MRWLHLPCILLFSAASCLSKKGIALSPPPSRLSMRTIALPPGSVPPAMYWLLLFASMKRCLYSSASRFASMRSLKLVAYATSSR